MPSQTITLHRTLNTPPAAVYYAFTNTTALREWLADGAQISANEGGNLYLTWNAGYRVCGKYTRLVPNQQIAFTWQGDGEAHPTDVNIDLGAQGSSTKVTLTHSGIDTAESAQTFTREWAIALENLQSTLETGLDLRFTRRPLLGIYTEFLTAEKAAELGVPVTAGILLSGVSEGLGAQQAGLQAKDVIVSLGGKPTTDGSTFTAAVSEHKAGDIVEVEFCRGGTKQTVSMKLSQRPIPDVPESPEEVAERMKTLHAELDAELDALFVGVSEDEAARRPAPAEWSAKEVIAHLIWNERFNQMWTWGLVGGDDAFAWPDNNYTQIAGVLASYPTTADLVAELKRAEVASRAIITSLPAEFMARKASYRRMALSWFNTPDHHREHFQQIRAALAAAREKVPG
jgi:uncharacterized protein YndB with AHSA1/START domain